MQKAQKVAEKVIANVEKVIVGKHNEVQLTLLALLCQGHLLIEDVPGVGKTMLAKSIARSIGCTFRRIQFTPDMLPSDVTGVSVFNQKTREFDQLSWNAWKNGKSPLMAQPILWPGLSWFWLLRTPSSTKALSLCQRPNWTAS